MKELVLRIGHSTERAALNYQHAAKGRDQEIASALDKLIKKERGVRNGSAKKRRSKRIDQN